MKPLTVLVACEFSGAVRRAFRERGHDAWSCDLLPAEDGSPYQLQGDVMQWLRPNKLFGGPEFWDMMIAFPPCTHLASSGARWFPAKRADGSQAAGIALFLALVNAPVPRICIENPVGIMSTHFRKPDQIIQPHHFGHAETKATCLWLRGLPLLVPTTPDLQPDYMRRPDGSYYTDAKGKRYSRIHFMSGRKGSDERQRERGRTYDGIARAMAEQWSNALVK